MRVGRGEYVGDGDGGHGGRKEMNGDATSYLDQKMSDPWKIKGSNSLKMEVRRRNGLA